MQFDLPPRFHYKGLTFPRWRGFLSNEELKSGKVFYAFFGGRKLCDRAIQYHVDRMIDNGEYQPQAA